MRPEWPAHIDELLGQYRTMRDRLGETQRQIAQLQATAESPDGLVEVTVGPRGGLASLKNCGRASTPRPTATGSLS